MTDLKTKRFRDRAAKAPAPPKAEPDAPPNTDPAGSDVEPATDPKEPTP